jgi:hypothetical protein
MADPNDPFYAATGRFPHTNGFENELYYSSPPAAPVGGGGTIDRRLTNSHPSSGFENSSHSQATNSSELHHAPFLSAATGAASHLTGALPSRLGGRSTVSLHGGNLASGNPYQVQPAQRSLVSNSSPLTADSASFPSSLFSSTPYDANAPQQFDLNKTLYLGDLSYFCTENDLFEQFIRYGPLSSVRVHRGKTGNPLLHGLVAFQNEDDARRALGELNELDYMGRTLRYVLLVNFQCKRS